MKTTERTRGFTLVEVMTVVAIIGILGGVAVPNVIRAMQRAKVKKAESELAMIAAAVRQLSWDTQDWPARRQSYIDTKDLTANGSSWADEIDLTGPASTHLCGLTKGQTNHVNWKGPYISEVPTDPWGQHYQFDPDYPLVRGVEIGNTKGNANTYLHTDWAPVVLSYGPNKVGTNVFDSDDIWIRVGDIYSSSWM